MTCELVNELPKGVVLLESKGTVKTKSKLFREIINKVSSYIIEADLVEVAVEINNHYWLLTQEEDFEHPDKVLSELEMYAANIVNTEFPEIEEKNEESILHRIKSVINKFVSKDAPPIPELRPKLKSAEESENLSVDIVDLSKETTETGVSEQGLPKDEGSIMVDAIKNLTDLK